MTTGLSQQQTVASKVERLVERAMALAVDEHDDAVAVARLAWLAQDDQAALGLAGARHRDHAAPAAGGARPGLAQPPGTPRAAGGARPASSARRRPPSMQNQAVVSYGEWSARQAGTGG